jgi:hypothetical protein
VLYHQDSKVKAVQTLLEEIEAVPKGEEDDDADLSQS